MQPFAHRSKLSRRALTRGAIVAASLAVLAAPSAYAQAPARPTIGTSAKVGMGLYEVAVSETTNSVYVASTGTTPAGGPAILVLDGKTLAVKSRIDATGAAPYGLAINDRTQTLYTTNTRVGSVSAIDLKTGRVVSTIKVAADPTAHVFRALVDEEANMVYVSIATAQGKVWVIDGRTNQLAAVIDSVGSRTTGLAIDKAANRLYAANQGTNEIAVIDLATRKVVARYATGGLRSTQLAFDAKTNRLFITNQESGDVTVIDTKTGQLLKAVKTGATALSVAFNSATNRLYVANRGTGTVTVIDGTSYQVLADLPTGTLPNTIAIDRTTNVAYVTNKARGAPARGGAPAVDDGGDTVTPILP